MVKTRREADVLQAVQRQGRCSIAELAEGLRVSEETVRRAVRPLVADGLLNRVHGAVMLPGLGAEPPFQRRMLERQGAKQAIGAAVAALVRDGDALMLDTGSTTTHAARALRGHAGLFVVTNSVEIARTLAGHNGNRVYIPGGEVRADDGAVFGAAACEFVRQFHVDYAIVSVGALHARSGIMDHALAEAELARAMLGQAECGVVVADQSKFGQRASVRVAPLAALDILASDGRPDEPLERALEEAGVTLRLAP